MSLVRALRGNSSNRSIALPDAVSVGAAHEGSIWILVDPHLGTCVPFELNGAHCTHVTRGIPRGYSGSIYADEATGEVDQERIDQERL
jgi:hypothetical protein